MGKKILIIEDEIEIAEALKIILESKGFTVGLLDNFSDKGVVAKILPDLILLDLKVRDMKGEDIAKIIKSDNATKEIPVIIVSGMPMESLKSAAKACGAADFIQKPFNIDGLLHSINRVLLSELA